MRTQHDSTYDTFGSVLGTKTRLSLVEYLTREGVTRQVQIASDLDVSQSAITRAKQPLIETDVIDETGQGLSLNHPHSLIFEQLLEEFDE